MTNKIGIIFGRCAGVGLIAAMVLMNACHSVGQESPISAINYFDRFGTSFNFWEDLDRVEISQEHQILAARCDEDFTMSHGGDLTLDSVYQGGERLFLVFEVDGEVASDLVVAYEFNLQSRKFVSKFFLPMA